MMDEHKVQDDFLIRSTRSKQRLLRMRGRKLDVNKRAADQYLENSGR